MRPGLKSHDNTLQRPARIGQKRVFVEVGGQDRRELEDDLTGPFQDAGRVE